MAKSTYQNLITIPTSGTDTISDGSTVGGDIVSNFKKIADNIHPDGSTDVEVAGVLVAGGVNVFDENADDYSMNDSPRRYVSNNDFIGMVWIADVSNLVSHDSVDSKKTVGAGSGAFMKGVLIADNSQTEHVLIPMPYAGGMIIHYDLLAPDGGTIYTETGTMQAFDDGIDSMSEKVTTLGTFRISNGSLVFKPKSGVNVIQIGLHGTILCGSSQLTYSQNGSCEYSDDYSS